MNNETQNKISVVTPSFNQGAFIANAIQSVLVQNEVNVEHIIVDNCSTDGTPEVLARYPHLKVVCEPDKGQSDALNKGFQRVTGDIVGWLNADDKYLPGCFKAVADFFQAHPECDVLYGDYRWVDAAGKVLRDRREIEFDFFILKYLHVLYIPSTATFFRRKIFDEGHFIDERYHYSMDYEFFLRLALKGYRFAHLNRFLADFCWHADNKSRFVVKAEAEQRQALLRHDPCLRSVPAAFQPFVWTFLMALARAKRTWGKSVRAINLSLGREEPFS